MTDLLIPVILCGGSGTRLWPMSRERHPKQFLKLVGENSLLEETAQRTLRATSAKKEHILTVTLGDMAGGVKAQLADTRILAEPSARNTAAAVAFAALYVEKEFGKDAYMLVLPSDHHIADEHALKTAFERGLTAAKQDRLVTFGIRPTRPETGYGYIRLGDTLPFPGVRTAAAFVEKPAREVAEIYLASGDYLWNSGMFLFSAGNVLKEFEQHAPDVLNGVRAAIAAGKPDAPDAAAYAKVASQPFDKAIMEKSAQVAVVPCDLGWSDIGGWQSLWEIRKQDGNGNVTEGQAVLAETKDSLILSKGSRLVACAGLKNMVVIDTGDAVFVGDKTDTDSMRALIAALKKANRPELIAFVKELEEA